MEHHYSYTKKKTSDFEWNSIKPIVRNFELLTYLLLKKLTDIK